MDKSTGSADLNDLLAHSQWVRALARRLARDQQSADDLVQETWLVALRKPPRPGPELRGWLARVLSRSARRQERSDRRRRSREARALHAGVDPRERELVLEVDEQQRISRAVLGLAEPYRSVVLRHYWRGESPARIARQTGRSAATVRSQLSRGRAELRKSLESDFGDNAQDMRAGLLAAAGPGPLAWLFLNVQDLLLVKQTQKLTWMALAAVAIASLGVGWKSLGPKGSAELDRDLGSQVQPELEVAGQELTPSIPESSRESRELLGSREERQTEGTSTSATGFIARFVDVAGHSIRGVRLTDEWAGPGAMSDETGHLSLEIDEDNLQAWEERPRPRTLLAKAEGHATRRVRATAIAGELTDLGVLVLQPGASISGWVVNGQGVGLDQVKVYATGVELDAPRETLRGRGPRNLGEALHGLSEQGRFRLTGLPLGEVRLWAKSAGCGWVMSDPIELRAGAEPVESRLVMRALPREDLILGRVVDETGVGVPDARLIYTFPSEFRGFRYESTDDRGHFEIVTEARAPHDISVEDTRNLLRPTILRDVMPGAEPLKVVMPTPVWMHVRAIDASTGEGVEDPWIYTRGRDTHEYDSRAARQDEELEVGSRWVRVPQERFVIHANKDGFAPLEEGPHDPRSAPLELVLRMQRLATVRGIVTHAGAPVVGASVQLLELAPRDQELTSYGFRMRVDPFGEFRTETAEDGSYSIAAHTSGQYLLLVTQPGLAVAERGPIDIDPRQDRTGVDLELLVGGSLEGRIRTPGGTVGAGQLVSISRGDGDVRFTRTDDSGLYRFEHLTPGGWQVVHRDRESDRSVTYRGLAESDPGIQWDCQVVNGQTTRHDLDSSTRTLGVLRGQLEFDGVGARGWSASMARRRDEEVVDPSRSVTLDDNGEFQLQGAAGTWHLWLRSPGGGEPTTMVFGEVTLGAEPTEWSRDFELASLSGSSNRGERPLRYHWQDMQGTSLRASFTSTVEGTFEVSLPAGDGVILGGELTEDSGGRYRWHELRKVSLAAGAHKRVDLDQN